MNAVHVNEVLLAHFQKIAEHKHLSVETLISQALEEYLEDYLDVLAAEEVLAKINSGEEQILSLEEAEKMLNELAD